MMYSLLKLPKEELNTIIANTADRKIIKGN